MKTAKNAVSLAGQRPSSTSHDAEFLPHRVPYFSEPSADCHRRFDGGKTSLKNVFCCICVGVLFVSAAGAAEHRLRDSTSSINNTAGRTLLRRVLSWDFSNLSAKRDSFVFTQHSKTPPASTHYTSVQTAFLHAPTRSAHILNIQLLDEDDAVVIGVPLRFAMENVVALATNFSVKSSNSISSFFIVFRSSLSAGFSSLCTSESRSHLSKVVRIFYEALFRVGDQVDATSIDSDRRFNGRYRIWNIHFTHDRTEPLINVALYRANLRFTFKRTMYDSSDWSEFWKAKDAVFQPPISSPRLSTAKHVSPFSFPAGLVGKPIKMTLPGMLQLKEDMCLNITRYVGEPWKFGSNRRQLVRLIERTRMVLVAAWMCVTHETLLVCNIPKKPQGVVPFFQTGYLLGCRIDPVAKPAMNNHERNSSRIPTETVGCSRYFRA